MRKIKKIAIIGVGFMGGSLALGLRKKFPRVKIWGFARSQKSFQKLKRLGFLNRVERDLASLVSDSDLIVFGLPVKTICSYFKKIRPFLKKGAIVIDLGSTKKLIQASAKKSLPSAVNFVGCHPLAGSEKKGAEFSRANLYQNSVCLITASAKSKSAQEVKRLWKKLGCRVVFISAAEHDKVLSAISHLPHVLAFSLTKFIPERCLKFSTASFKDLTRISKSPASLWADIFSSNRKNIAKDLNAYIKVLKQYQNLLKKNDSQALFKLIEKANRKQERVQ